MLCGEVCFVSPAVFDSEVYFSSEALTHVKFTGGGLS